MGNGTALALDAGEPLQLALRQHVKEGAAVVGGLVGGGACRGVSLALVFLGGDRPLLLVACRRGLGCVSADFERRRCFYRPGRGQFLSDHFLGGTKFQSRGVHVARRRACGLASAALAHGREGTRVEEGALGGGGKRGGGVLGLPRGRPGVLSNNFGGARSGRHVAGAPLLVGAGRGAGGRLGDAAAPWEEGRRGEGLLGACLFGRAS